jgi:hypothetical protein
MSLLKDVLSSGVVLIVDVWSGQAGDRKDSLPKNDLPFLRVPELPSQSCYRDPEPERGPETPRVKAIQRVAMLSAEQRVALKNALVSSGRKRSVTSAGVLKQSILNGVSGVF